MTGPAERAPAAQRALTAERARTEARIAALQRDFDGIVAAAAATADDEHDPEGSSTAFDRQHVAALLAHAQTQLADIARAQRRLADGSYGTCDRCGGPIAAGRLAARPTAATCITCASSHRP